MKELIITPELAKEAEIKNKPAVVVISRMNVLFNHSAVKLLALKKGVQFQIIVKDNSIFYRDVVKDGFEISLIDKKGASCITKGLHILLNEYFQKNDKSYRFELGEFKEGFRILIPKN